ncbi:MAG TPA: dihydrodipicolinate synthase family protein [Flavisolibacter sp.]|nr:dihydrodipicolinate synthase family protein [Flavisolibacter sp.]
MKKEKQVIVPTVTPLTKDYRLDEGAVKRMFSNFSAHGVMPFILGTTGESASLPLSLKKAFVTKATSLKSAGTVLYAGIASNCLEESIVFGNDCFEKGVDVVAANLPSYYALSNDQIKRYFETLADALTGPLIIYNIPATTHMSIPLDLIDELSHHQNIIGIKDSERSEERLQKSLSLWKDRDDFSHYLGWAAKSADALLGGSDGLIPSTGNLVPSIYADMLKAVSTGDREKAYQCQILSDVFGDLYQKGKLLGESLWALKVMMKEAGLCEEYVMPPLQSMSNDERTKLVGALHQLQNQESIKITV